ncbi:MAG: DUF177 domain-containing protein [Proteobacteria bacterium]|nr:DUF177 domain-containing protein [Pseudomonadota bacterium]
MSSASAAPEFSRVVALERIGTGWLTQTIVASAEERAALARRFALVELGALEATVRLRRARAGRYVELDARLRAAVVQSCVVTLDPVAAALDEPFALLFGPLDAPAATPGSVDLVVDLDEPEPLEGDSLDIGELVAQQLSLALDPYPRSAAAADDVAAASSEAAGAAGQDPQDNPFAALQTRTKPK